ncbi:MAG: ribose transport system permease protein [Chthoniobacter sp.]|nr:ribose transport system permease protein [Chthoniobacter sp.]
MSPPAQISPEPKRQLRLQEGGLLLAILVIGTLLSIFGGTVKTPRFEVGADGQRHRVFVTDAAGERTAAVIEKNKFLNAQNLAQLAKDTSFIAIMAVGITFVIIAGGIDLSVGAIYALASVLGAMAFHAFENGSIWPGVLACLGAATACGLANGAMIVALGVHPFIITLGTMAVFRGVAFVVTHGQSVGGFPPHLREIVRYETSGGLSVVPLAVMVVVAIAGSVFLARMAAGRRVYAIGGNELASRFSGIQVNRVKLGVYVCSGLTAGIAALIALGYYGAATSGDGQGYELNVIAASVVGGASLSGGRGTAFGAVLGALLIQMISSGIVILGIDQNYSQILIGTVVILAVVLDQLNNWLAQRRLAARAGRK